MGRDGYSFTVVGAGIIGLSSAYCLAQGFRRCHIKVIYDKCSPETTSNHGFGICSLRQLDELDSPNTHRWCKATADYCKELVQNSPVLAREMGVNAVKGHFVDDKLGDLQIGRAPDTFADYREADEDELISYGIENRCKELEHVFNRKNIRPHELTLHTMGTWVVDNHSYLPWLKKEMELMAARGDISSITFVQKRLKRLSDADYRCDLIVNCSGLGAAYLANDKKIVPIRGQYLLLRPKKQLDLAYGGHTFICPKPGRIAVGSVYQRNRNDGELDPNDREDILRRACALNPDLKDLDVIHEDVGIRPGREGGPRVEIETRTSGVPVIHNYGHGAKGILQHWGCALEVKRLAVLYFNGKSKL